jgi:hypothetical protein
VRNRRVILCCQCAQRELRAHGGSEMTDAEHGNFERIDSHARAYYAPGTRAPTRKSAVIIEKFR